MKYSATMAKVNLTFWTVLYFIMSNGFLVGWVLLEDEKWAMFCLVFAAIFLILSVLIEHMNLICRNILEEIKSNAKAK